MHKHNRETGLRFFTPSAHIKFICKGTARYIRKGCGAQITYGFRTRNIEKSLSHVTYDVHSKYKLTQSHICERTHKNGGIKSDR